MLGASKYDLCPPLGPGLCYPGDHCQAEVAHPHPPEEGQEGGVGGRGSLFYIYDERTLGGINKMCAHKMIIIVLFAYVLLYMLILFSRKGMNLFLMVGAGLWFRHHFLRIRIRLFLSLRIRIQLTKTVE